MSRTSRKLLLPQAPVGENAGGGELVGTIARAFEILRCFEAYHLRLGNREIARRTGLAKSTVSRLTYTLTRLGYLVYLPDDLKYKLGDAAAALGSSILRGLDFRSAVRPHMQEIADHIPAVCGMTIRDRTEMVYIEHAVGRRAVSITTTMGSRIPIGTTAAGRAYVLSLSPADREALLAELDRHEPAQARILRDRLPWLTDIFSERGYALSLGDHIEHIYGIAVPLRSPELATCFVLTIGGLASLMTEERLFSDIGPRLLTIRDKIGNLLAGVESQRMMPVPSD